MINTDMKHAFLIMAHNQFSLLKQLVELLMQNERCDLYIHIDKKAVVPQWLTVLGGGKNNLHLCHSIDIRWGDFSQIQTELLLFEEAYKNGPYQYYHILSGVDLPIKPIDDILQFFDVHNGKEFVGIVGPEQQQKVMRYNLLMRHAKRTDENAALWFFYRLLRKCLSLSIEKVLPKRSCDGKSFVLGHNWVSITNEACSFILRNKSYLQKRFKYTRCADEFFVQTLLWNSPFRKQLWNTENFDNGEWVTAQRNRATKARNNNEGAKREIDWNRGNPYVWGQSSEDLETLKNSNQLFARKFDETISAWLIPKIVQMVERNTYKDTTIMYKKLLSIIIPTYNMEKYLRRCLDSLIVKENFKMLEVWVVNDGSKDSSSAIAHEYADKYPTVFNVIDKPNGNYGSCINAALPKCAGKYVKILDSDDYFNTPSFEALLQKLQDHDEDLILTDYIIVNEREEVSSVNTCAPLKPDEKIPVKGFYQNIQMHSVAYKTQNLRKIGYTQTEGISYTDREWVFWPMTSVKTIYYLPFNVYCYFVGREGQTMNNDVYVKNISHEITITMRMIKQWTDYQNEIGDARIYLDRFIANRMVYLIFNDIHLYKGVNQENFIEMDKEIKEKYPLFYSFSSENCFIGSNFKYKIIKHWRKNYNIKLYNPIIATYLILHNVKHLLK